MVQDVAMKLGNMNVDVVTDALAQSTLRIMSPKYMKAGMGDGGSCHPRDNIALRWLARELDLGYDMFDTIIVAREKQAANMAKYLKKLSAEHNLPIVIIGRGFKPDVPYEDGSPSILVSQFCDCTFDDFSKPSVFLLAHSHKTTFGSPNTDYKFPEGSIIVDPWRERPGAIPYGNTR
jgi:UDPglucose 6-dehydrogenase